VIVKNVVVVVFFVKCGNDLNCGGIVWRCEGSENLRFPVPSGKLLKMCKNLEVVKMCEKCGGGCFL
jgi:hypothetical protein